MPVTIKLILFLNLLVLGWSDVAVKITPPILELTEHIENASFTCNIENHYGSAPIIEWYFKPFHENSTLAENGYFHFTISKNGYLISLTNVTRSSAGYYSCYVTNKIGNLEYRKSAQAVLHINHAPYFSTNLTGFKDIYEPFYGTNFHFNSTIPGHPTPTVEYYYRRFSESENKNRKLESINLQIISPENDGTYTLVATNKFGSARTSFKLQGKHRAPEIKRIKFRDHISVKENKNYYYNLCDAISSKPILMMSWELPGGMTITNRNATQNNVQLTYIKDVEYLRYRIRYKLKFDKFIPANVGQYKCKVANDLGSDEIFVDFRL